VVFLLCKDESKSRAVANEVFDKGFVFTKDFPGFLDVNRLRIFNCSIFRNLLTDFGT